VRLFLVLVFGLLGSTGSDLRAQASLTNDDVPKHVKSGLSEGFMSSRARDCLMMRHASSNSRIMASASALSQRLPRRILRRSRSPAMD